LIRLCSSAADRIPTAAEVHRQIDILSSGGRVAQETRGYDEFTAQTYTLRSKEDAPDYRYMPDPNLPPLLLTQAHIDVVRAAMPVLPAERRTRLLDMGLTAHAADVLMAVDAGKEIGLDGEVGRGGVMAYFEEVRQGRDPRIVSNWYGILTLNLLANVLNTDKREHQGHSRTPGPACATRTQFRREYNLCLPDGRSRRPHRAKACHRFIREDVTAAHA
jgi:Asp-tRNA(Asn)/Glu-tRNA(Gln) amidotransferase B subunit